MARSSALHARPAKNRAGGAAPSSPHGVTSLRSSGCAVSRDGRNGGWQWVCASHLAWACLASQRPWRRRREFRVGGVVARRPARTYCQDEACPTPTGKRWLLQGPVVGQADIRHLEPRRRRLSLHSVRLCPSVSEIEAFVI